MGRARQQPSPPGVRIRRGVRTLRAADDEHSDRIRPRRRLRLPAVRGTRRRADPGDRASQRLAQARAQTAPASPSRHSCSRPGADADTHGRQQATRPAHADRVRHRVRRHERIAEEAAGPPVAAADGSIDGDAHGCAIFPRSRVPAGMGTRRPARTRRTHGRLPGDSRWRVRRAEWRGCGEWARARAEHGGDGGKIRARRRRRRRRR
mmetsp:Transcript_11998/g.55648  ORF Transcript_11998/g.55648 Transcript_11998/m.55648 type:complete len:207 (-) Transcript_11998:3359-3979(-)